MNEDSFDNLPERGDATELRTLAREIRIAKGFTLIFAVCNRAADRKARIAEFRAANSGLTIREFYLGEQTNSLLDILRSNLPDPPPDAVFVYGMENWISGNESPRSYPFVLNLNAGRNHFTEDCPCPLVLWMPEFMLRVLAEGAPDFSSIHSGVYRFSSSPNTKERIFMSEILGEMALFAFTPQEREGRLAELTELLGQMRGLPEENHNLKEQAAVLEQISLLYMVQGHKDKAGELANQTLKIREQVLGPNHPDTAKSLNTLAALYAELYKEEEALPLAERALETREQVLGPNHLDTAESLDTLANLYEYLGRWNVILPLAERALKIREQALGPNHPDVARSLKCLAHYYTLLHRYTDALPLYKRALEIFERTLGLQYPTTTYALYDLAILYENMGRYADALPLYERALKIREQVLGQNHSVTVLVREKIEKLREAMGLTT